MAHNELATFAMCHYTRVPTPAAAPSTIYYQLGYHIPSSHPLCVLAVGSCYSSRIELYFFDSVNFEVPINSSSSYSSYFHRRNSVFDIESKFSDFFFVAMNIRIKDSTPALAIFWVHQCREIYYNSSKICKMIQAKFTVHIKVHYTPTPIH